MSAESFTGRLLRSQAIFNAVVIGSVLLGFVTLIGVVAAGVVTMYQNINYTRWVTHTYAVEAAIADFRILNERVETARRGYLLSQDQRFEETVRNVAADVVAATATIERMTADNPAQQANVAALKPLVATQLRAIEISMAAARQGGDTTAFFEDTAVASTRSIRTLTSKMVAEEAAKLAEREKASSESMSRLTAISILGGVLLMFVGGGSIWIILRYTHDLTASRADLSRMNLGLEDEVRIRTSDLQRANDEIQRFAYIVSHDLRSPLVNVMGFTAELEAAAKPLSQLLERAESSAPAIVTEEARTAVRRDLPEAIGFIRTSTQKMDRLINAILRLSREGRRVLTPEPLDTARLFEGIAANLKHRSTELGATIAIDPAVPPILSDRLALEQVFSNLIENALKYLKPGRPGEITISGIRQGERIVYEVTDNGRGIDPKDHERVFDLFRRSGVQDQPGEGIGLAHVRALAYRLGGTITCQSALDQGATFRVSLPAKLMLEGSTA